MKKRLILLVLALVFLLAVPVSAESSVTTAAFSASAAQNGSCQVTIDLQLHLDSPQSDLTFPLPRQARSVSLNGSAARTWRSGETLMVDLSRIVGKAAGDFSLRVQYTLPHVVSYNDLGVLELELPMLQGFLIPIDSFAFTLTLPGDNGSKPAFFSGYYQQSIETDITVTSMAGMTVSGTVDTRLKDRETLRMVLPVTEELFPQSPIEQWRIGFSQIAMVVLGGLALLYWLIFLAGAPLLRRHSAAAPEGVVGGTVPCALMGSGADLTMLVLSWAQLGYILIHMRASGRIILHKRMDMGNERSAYEVRIFKALFGTRDTVDATGYHFATLHRSTAGKRGDVSGYFKKTSGNSRLLRYLCVGIGLFGGSAMGSALAGDAILGFLLIGLLAIAGAISARIMLQWTDGFWGHGRIYLRLALVLGAVWLVLGLAAGDIITAAAMVAAQFLGGALITFGGRRTPHGRYTAQRLLGLRHYLRTLGSQEAQRLQQLDPTWFFQMAPMAMALGVLRPFARRFGSKGITACPYLTSGMDGHLNTMQWAEQLERAANTMDMRQRRLPIDRLLGK